MRGSGTSGAGACRDGGHASLPPPRRPVNRNRKACRGSSRATAPHRASGHLPDASELCRRRPSGPDGARSRHPAAGACGGVPQHCMARDDRTPLAARRITFARGCPEPATGVLPGLAAGIARTGADRRPRRRGGRRHRPGLRHRPRAARRQHRRRDDPRPRDPRRSGCRTRRQPIQGPTCSARCRREPIRAPSHSATTSCQPRATQSRARRSSGRTTRETGGGHGLRFATGGLPGGLPGGLGVTGNGATGGHASGGGIIANDDAFAPVEDPPGIRSRAAWKNAIASEARAGYGVRIAPDLRIVALAPSPDARPRPDWGPGLGTRLRDRGEVPGRRRSRPLRRERPGRHLRPGGPARVDSRSGPFLDEVPSPCQWSMRLTQNLGLLTLGVQRARRASHPWGENRWTRPTISWPWIR